MSLSPEFVRRVDRKGRVTIPAAYGGQFEGYARVSLRVGRVVLVEPSLAGRQVHHVKAGWLTSRVMIPAEIRKMTGIGPGSRVAIATHARGLLIWAMEGGR